MFLSRMLTATEKNYWPTELEITGFVWTIKKVRHLIESSMHPVVIQTNHSAILDIMRQSSITSTTSTMRINVRLVRASQFLRQFRLDVRHKPNKEHIVSDVLSRLANSKSMLPEDHSKLDVLYACATQAVSCGNVSSNDNVSLYIYSAIIVKMNKAFRRRLVLDYQSDRRWRRIAEVVNTNTRLMTNDEGVELPFIRGITDSSLIFHRNKFTDLERLCISKSLIKNILEIAHNNDHPGFDRSFEIVFKSWYIRNLSRHLHDYIKHCPECLALQTRRHKLYDYM